VKFHGNAEEETDACEDERAHGRTAPAQPLPVEEEYAGDDRRNLQAGRQDSVDEDVAG